MSSKRATKRVTSHSPRNGSAKRQALKRQATGSGAAVQESIHVSNSEEEDDQVPGQGSSRAHGSSEQANEDSDGSFDRAETHSVGSASTETMGRREGSRLWVELLERPGSRDPSSDTFNRSGNQSTPAPNAGKRREAKGFQPSSVGKPVKPTRKPRNDASKAPVAKPTGSSSSATARCSSCADILNEIPYEGFLPPRPRADELVAAYFAKVHPVFPILDEPAFKRRYEYLWEPSGQSARRVACAGLCKQDTLGRVFFSMVNTVFALGLLLTSNTPAVRKSTAMAADLFKKAEDVLELSDVLLEDSSIEMVQLLLLRAQYLHSTGIATKCRDVARLAIGRAQDMGLHLLVKGPPHHPLTEVDSAKQIRLWAGCVLLDWDISWPSGKPLIVTEHSMDCLKSPAWDERLLELKAREEGNSSSTLDYCIEAMKLHKFSLTLLKEVEPGRGAVSAFSLVRLPEPAAPSDTAIDVQSAMDVDNEIMCWWEGLGRLTSHLRYEPPSEQDCRDRFSSPENIATSPYLSQSRRFYTRLLSARVLNLRPALEQLYHDGQQPKVSITQTTEMVDVTELRMSEDRATASDIQALAAQSVASAKKLVNCAEWDISGESLVASWNYLGYLQMCASVILMARVCYLNDSPEERESLAVSWERALKCISHYEALSAVATKSYNELRESARRLLWD
ncbi:hypothetical protein GE09DRAFT_394953 [Coniochaeta sp. 2T2.1]|nr:hypothetical protein GE09DRAFT_394953 [Coniochaeta sp. 2T2.1]